LNCKVMAMRRSVDVESVVGTAVIAREEIEE